MPEDPRAPVQSRARVLVAGLVVTLLVGALAVVVRSIGRSPDATRPEAIDALATSTDRCVTCHRQSTAGIVEQYGHSTMAAAGVSCRDCHEAQEGSPGAIAHEGTFVLNQPSTATCARCHQNEVAQFVQSRHGLPAYLAYAGTTGLTDAQLAQYKGIPEGGFAPDQSRNAIAVLEGEQITHFTCAVCHAVGQPAADGSTGQCWRCHLRHEFSLEQARKPETCNACHIGPDHPQWEIYVESAHGIAYHTGGDRWGWEAKPGTLTVRDFPAPTCALCHFSGFGNQGTTHDVGDRLTWYLFAPISERRPVWQDNRAKMQGVCRSCHNQNFVQDFYDRADAATEAVNGFVRQSQDIMSELKTAGLLTPAPFDEPIEFVAFETWHHYGRTTKFGTWMQGPDYAQWHGAYEVVKGLAELRAMAAEMKEKAHP
jgi:hydroxylamine dehydrogenase